MSNGEKRIIEKYNKPAEFAKFVNLEVWPRIRGELLAKFHKLPEGRRGRGRMLGGDRNSAAATIIQPAA